MLLTSDGSLRGSKISEQFLCGLGRIPLDGFAEMSLHSLREFVAVGVACLFALLGGRKLLIPSPAVFRSRVNLLMIF